MQSTTRGLAFFICLACLISASGFTLNHQSTTAITSNRGYLGSSVSMASGASPATDQARPASTLLSQTDEQGSSQQSLQVQSCAMIGAMGGVVTGENGEVLDIPPGALGEVVNVCVSSLAESSLVDMVGLRPAETQYLGGIVIEPAGIAFDESVTITIPNEASVPPEAQILVSKVVDTGWIAGTGLSMLAQARVSLDQTHIVGEAEEPFPGIVAGGAIAFEQLEVPMGYVAGTAVDVDDQPMEGAVVVVLYADSTEVRELGSGASLGYLAVTNPSGQYHLPAQAGVSSQLAGIVDVGGQVIGGITDHFVAPALKQWAYMDLEIEEPEAELTVSYKLEIACADPVVVGQTGSCEAIGIRITEWTVFGVPHRIYERWPVTHETWFYPVPASSADFIGSMFWAREPGSIVVTGVHVLYGLDSVVIESVCPSGQIECAGKCFEGNCCEDSDCPEKRVCYKNSCIGWESGPLNVSPSAFLIGPSSPLLEAVPYNSATAVTLQSSSVSLYSILPLEGPSGTHPVTATLTQSFIGLTNAVEAYSVDFADDQTSEIQAEVFALKTLDGAYDHDYSVCQRFHEFVLESVTRQAYPDLYPVAPWFWQCTMQKDAVVEDALVFTVLVDEDTSPPQFLVDSRWLDDYYEPNPIYPPYDYMFNFQIWSRASASEAAELMRRTIERLSAQGTVSFFNTTEPVFPAVFVKSASYADGEIQLVMHSSLAETRMVHFSGTMRPYTDTTASIPFSFDEPVPPGTSLAVLPVEGMIDAVVLSEVDSFLDKVYVGGGFWFHFSDQLSEVSPVPMVCDTIEGFGSQDLPLAGCYHITGAVALQDGYVGMGRVFNPNGYPVDVSGYHALTFQAKGDGKSYRVTIETDSVDDYDFPQFVFTPPADDWRQFVIPLSLFRQQGWGEPVPFTGTDVKSVAWSSVGPHCDEAVELAVDRIAFTNSAIITDTTGPTSTNDVFGPYSVITEISGEGEIMTATLHYAVNGSGFSGVSLAGDENTFRGEIPGQPIGSQVRYYIEATDTDGNMATDPVDAPFTTYRFNVEWYPSLLVDDFNDMNPANVLGGTSGTFTDPDESGLMTPCYTGEVLRLGYEVTDHLPGIGEYAGYYSELGLADLTSYYSIVLDVRGEEGGEKVKLGLRDALGHEAKIELSEYFPNLITTEWQSVRVPLGAFTLVADWSEMDNVNLASEDRIDGGIGAIYVDNIRFEPAALAISIDNFSDSSVFNGVGGQHSVFTSGDAAISIDFDATNPYGGEGASLVVGYDGVDADSYAVWQTGLGGLEASAYDGLTLAVRGALGDEQFHVYLEDASSRVYVTITDYASITTDWQLVEIPLIDFTAQGVDVTHLEHLQVAFEWNEMDGTVFLDDLRLTLPPSPTIGSVFPALVSNDTYSTLTLTGTGFRLSPTVALGYHTLGNVTLLDSTTLQATVPPGMTPGTYDLLVIQPNMQFGTLSRAVSVRGKIYLPLILRH